jgi:hypothetical protein
LREECEVAHAESEGVAIGVVVESRGIAIRVGRPSSCKPVEVWFCEEKATLGRVAYTIRAGGFVFITLEDVSSVRKFVQE